MKRRAHETGAITGGSGHTVRADHDRRSRDRVWGEEKTVISSILPSSGESGMVVTVTGSGFQDREATNWVDFGTATADALEWSDTEIKVKVPSGVDAGEYEVTVTTEVGTSQVVNFEITEADSI